jgi:hypothetical protein
LWTFQEYITNESTINSNIDSFYIDGNGYSLDTSLMHPLVFETVNSVFVSGTIGSIQTDLFKHFKRIYSVSLQLDSLDRFVHEIGIKWTLSMPNQSYVFIVEADLINKTE